MGRIAQCNQCAEQKQRRLAAEEEREVTARDFSAYGRPLEMVTSFRYLGLVISVIDDDWPEVVKNLSRARAVWRRMRQILSREGGGAVGVRLLFKGWGAGGYVLWIGDLSSHPPRGQDPGGGGFSSSWRYV